MNFFPYSFNFSLLNTTVLWGGTPLCYDNHVKQNIKLCEYPDAFHMRDELNGVLWCSYRGDRSGSVRWSHRWNRHRLPRRSWSCHRLVLLLPTESSVSSLALWNLKPEETSHAAECVNWSGRTLKLGPVLTIQDWELGKHFFSFRKSRKISQTVCKLLDPRTTKVPPCFIALCVFMWRSVCFRLELISAGWKWKLVLSFPSFLHRFKVNYFSFFLNLMYRFPFPSFTGRFMTF